MIYQHLEANKLLVVEQMACYCGNRGTKDQLLIDKMLLSDARRKHKNLYIAWIDFRMAYDCVPHDWILKSLQLFGVHQNICLAIATSMKYWRTTLTCGGTTFGDVIIQQEIFQGDSLSSLLFVLALMPLTFLFHKTGKGYSLQDCLSKVNHLLYLDDIKLYAKSYNDLNSLLHILSVFSQDICMFFGLDKCNTTCVVRGKLEDVSLPSGDVICSFLVVRLIDTWGFWNQMIFIILL